MHLIYIPVLLLLTVALSSCPSKKQEGAEPVDVAISENQDTDPQQIPDTTSIVPEEENEPAGEIISNDKPKEVTKNQEPADQEPTGPIDRPRPLHPMVIITNDIPLETRSTSMKILSGSVKGTILTIEFSYGGGCKPHGFELFAPVNQPEAGVAQVYLTDVTTDDNCKKLITETMQFDIRKLKNPDLNSILIVINNQKPPIEWNYGRK